MISAARANGHIDESAMKLIRRQIISLGLEKLATAMNLDDQLVMQFEAPLHS